MKLIIAIVAVAVLVAAILVSLVVPEEARPDPFGGCRAPGAVC